MPRKHLKAGVRCPGCGYCIYSMHRHDFRRCPCGKVFVDGGDDYLRYGAEPPVALEEVQTVYSAKKTAAQMMSDMDKKPLPPPPKSYEMEKPKFTCSCIRGWEWRWLKPKFVGPMPSRGNHIGKIYKWRIYFGPWEFTRWHD